MPKKRRERSDAQPEQLVFPFELRVGDIVLEDGARAEVVAHPTAGTAGKTTRAWIRNEGDTAQRAVAREAWRKVRIVRRSAA